MIPLLASLLIPLNLCIALLVIAALALLIRMRKSALCLAIAGVLWALAWSLPATSLWAGGYLEQLNPPQAAASLPKATAIVVLGGHTAGGRENWFEPYDKLTATSRADSAADLYFAGLAPRIIVSGAAFDGTTSEAESMAASLRRAGVPPDVILMEKNSQTTYENAQYTTQLLKEHGIDTIVLVTSALHMPRSIASFKKQGIKVIPAAAPRQIIMPDTSGFSVWLPNQRALDGSRSIIKEYAGLLVYWLRGWI